MATQPSREDKRLWIGNLDPRVNEYQLLKLLQKHGKIEKFDLLFHKTGPLAGMPRGYAFVTYSQSFEAEKAMRMHNMLLGSKKVIVTWAHSIPTDIQEEPKKPDIKIPALAINKNETSHTNKEFQIQAIEAKLKMMESQSSKELEINKTVADERPVIPLYQPNTKTTTSGNGNSSGGYHRRHDSRTRDRGRRPYDRYKNR